MRPLSFPFKRGPIEDPSMVTWKKGKAGALYENIHIRCRVCFLSLLVRTMFALFSGPLATARCFFSHSTCKICRKAPSQWAMFVGARGKIPFAHMASPPFAMFVAHAKFAQMFVAHAKFARRLLTPARCLLTSIIKYLSRTLFVTAHDKYAIPHPPKCVTYCPFV